MFFPPPFRFLIGDRDPHWSSVDLLLKGEGSSIVDSSSYARTISISAGSPAISTAQKKFGASSILMATGSAAVMLRTDIGAAPASTAWTVEGWAYFTSYEDYMAFFSTDNANSVLFLKTSLNSGTDQLSLATGSTFHATDPDTFPDNQWVHFAAAKEAGAGARTVRLFVDGALKATGTTSITWSDFVRLGRSDNAGFSGFPGYLDEFRLTRGVCRYTAAFTAPTAAYPTS